MLQSLATLAFSLAGLAALVLMVALIANDWETVCRALGWQRAPRTSPLPPRLRVVATRTVPTLQVMPGELRHAA